MLVVVEVAWVDLRRSLACIGLGVNGASHLCKREQRGNEFHAVKIFKSGAISSI